MTGRNAWALVTALWIFGGLMVGGMFSGPTGTAQAMPQCALEDGSDIDGQCFWVDPDTGDIYINPAPQEVDA